jgi:hypothetical protein
MCGEFHNLRFQVLDLTFDFNVMITVFFGWREGRDAFEYADREDAKLKKSGILVLFTNTFLINPDGF